MRLSVLLVDWDLCVGIYEDKDAPLAYMHSSAQIDAPIGNFMILPCCNHQAQPEAGKAALVRKEEIRWELHAARRVRAQVLCVLTGYYVDDQECSIAMGLKVSPAQHRRTGEIQLKAVLVKHFGEDLGAINGSRGFERAFREMLWASEASEFLFDGHMVPAQSLQSVPDCCDTAAGAHFSTGVQIGKAP